MNSITKKVATELRFDQGRPEEINKSHAENVCQDVNFLQNYIDLKNTSTVNLSYSTYFSELEGTAVVQNLKQGKL